TQHAVIAIPPTTIPIDPCRALAGVSASTVMPRLATATAGAEENRPENAFGAVTSPSNANSTTKAPPASARTPSTTASRTARSGGPAAVNSGVDVHGVLVPPH